MNSENMKSGKTYVIRKIAFHYSDEYLYVNTIGGIEQVFDNKEEAEAEWFRLEREAFEEQDLGDIEQFSPCSGKHSKEVKVFNEFIKSKTGQDIAVIENDFVYCEMDTFLPEGLSDSDILHIREITGVKFYELAEFDGSPSFYGIWLKKPFVKNEGYLNYNGAPYFYNSREEALTEVKRKNAEILGSTKKIDISIEDLTETPVLFQSFVESSKNIKYNFDEKCLEIGYLNDDELVTLNGLLKNPCFEIREISYDEVKDIDHWTYEEM